MLKQGIYKAENGNSIFDSYEIVMEVKETEKSFIFKLIKLENRCGADRIQLLFSKSNKVVLRKQNSRHAMRTWEDDTFTIYPYCLRTEKVKSFDCCLGCKIERDREIVRTCL